MDVPHLDGQALTLSEIEAVSLQRCPVAIAQAARERMAQSRALIERIVAAGETVYGVNTGFGKLADVRISSDHLAQLQTNLVRSHAGGVGQPLSEPESRAMLLLRANVLAKGFSGSRVELAELLVACSMPRSIPSFRRKARWAQAATLPPSPISPWSSSAKAKPSTTASASPALKLSNALASSRFSLPPKKAWRCSTAPRPWLPSARLPSPALAASSAWPTLRRHVSRRAHGHARRLRRAHPARPPACRPDLCRRAPQRPAPGL